MEETIRELEKTLIEINIHPPAEQLYTDTPSKSSPVQMSDGQTSGTKRPPVPPKPSSLSPASIQVHVLHQNHVLTQHELFSFSAASLWVTSLSGF